MSDRLILINAEETWSFCTQLWRHALDLYPLESGLRVWNAAKPTRERGDGIEAVIGGFPEAFSDDGAAMRDELRAEFLDLVKKPEKRLGVLVLFSREDIVALRAASAGRSAPLSPGGRIAAEALHGLLAEITAQKATQDEVSPALTRIWLAAAIRKAGAHRADETLSGALHRNFSSGVARLHSVFMLSNGAGLDESSEAERAHFLKMRVAIDLMRAPGAEWGRLREPQSGFGASLAAPRTIRISFPPGEVPVAHRARAIAVALATCNAAAGPSSEADADSPDAISAFEEQIDELKNEVDREADNRMNAARELTADLEAHPDEPERTWSLRTHKEKLGEIRSELLRQTGFWRSGKRAESLRQAEATFKAGEAWLPDLIAKAAEELIVRAKKDPSDEARLRLSIQTRLDNLKPPSGEAGLRAVADRREALEKEHRTLAERNTAARHSVRDEAAGRAARGARRAAGFAAAREAEENLLDSSVLGTPLGVVALSLATFVVVMFARSEAGSPPALTWTAIWAAFGPVAYVVCASLVAAIIGAFITARVARTRAMTVRGDLAHTLDQDWEALESAAANLIATPFERMRATHLLMAIQSLGPAGGDNTKACDKFSDIIGGPGFRADDKLAADELARAQEAFRRVAPRTERVRAFLKEAPATRPGVMAIEDLATGRETIRIPSTLAESVTVELLEPGDG